MSAAQEAHEFSSPSVTSEIEDLVTRSLLGRHDAIHYVLQAFDTMHMLDDLVDGDRFVDRHELIRRVFHAMVTMPANSFFQENQGVLSGVLVAGLVNWVAANGTEESFIAGDYNESALRVSFVTRSTYMDLISVSATIVGGIQHGAAVAKEVREYCTSEGFDFYLSALKKERRRA